MKKYNFCPNCQIGLNSREMELGFCQNCKHDWTDEEDDYDDEYEENQRQADDEINEMNDW